MSFAMFKQRAEETVVEPLPGDVDVRIDGWPITVADQASALAHIRHAMRTARGFCVLTMNLDHLVKLRTDAAFRTAYKTAGIVTADGAPVAWLARRQDARIVRTTGADLMLPLAKLATDEGASVFLLGSTENVLQAAGNVLVHHSGGQLKIAGIFAPSHQFDPTGTEADRAIAMIKASGARLVFLAFGAPKQEIFASYACRQNVNAGFICGGASLDFLAGTQSRAPVLFQRTNLEWLWRLLLSPRRLGMRYWRCAMLLAELVIASTSKR